MLLGELAIVESGLSMKRMMGAWLAGCVMAICASFAQAATVPDNAIARAAATPHNSGDQVYVEYYLDNPDSNDVRARYFSKEGLPVAQKRLRYAENSDLPLFEVHDFRNSTGYRVLPMGDRLRIQSLRLLENNLQAVVDVREVPVVAPTVIDAGFHRFLLQHWDEVASGEKVRFNFLQIDQARLMPMILRRISCPRGDRLCIKVELNNYFQRLFVPPVLLTYDAASRKLLNYSGYGPLMSENGMAYPVTLNYEYLQTVDTVSR
ncbi:MAG: hypothetical protein AAF404_13730 [Pseudomonadota bacterium]